MDSTTRSIIDKITRKHDTPLTVGGGLTCSVVYHCSELSPNDMARLAADATGHLDHDSFDLTVGIAYTGILFASAIAGGRQVSILQESGNVFGPDVAGRRVVVVDDVVFSGKRLAAAADLLKSLGANVVGYACIVDRSDGYFSSPNPPLELPLWSAFRTELL